MKKDIETINKIQTEMKNTISEQKNTVQGVKSRLDEAEDQTGDRRGRVKSRNMYKGLMYKDNGGEG